MVDGLRISARTEQAAWRMAIKAVFASKEIGMGQIPTAISLSALGRHIGD